MVITRTPFRISFFGGGTDYPAWYKRYGTGAVLSTSIDKYCYLTCRVFPPFFEHSVRVVWSKIELGNQPDEIEHPLVRAALKFFGIKNGIEIHHQGDLPARSGVGSSSSFAVGLLHALYALQGRTVSKQQLALDAIHLQQELAKEHVGSQDQPAAAYGGFNKIVFGDPAQVRVEPLALSSERLQALESRLMLFFTGLSRTASEIAVQWIENTSRNEQELHRMREMVDEAIPIVSSSRDLRAFGEMLHEAWERKRKLAGAITTPHVDEIYAAAREAGAGGGKLLGAGGGGFILLYVEPENQDVVRRKLKNLLYVPFRFDTTGSQIVYYTQDDAGFPNGKPNFYET